MASATDLINYVAFKPSGIFSVSDVTYLWNSGQMAGPHGIIGVGDNSNGAIGASYPQSMLTAGMYAISSDQVKPTWVASTSTDASSGYNRTAVIKSDGKLYTRGYSGGTTFQCLGRTGASNLLLPVNTDTDWTKVSCGLFNGYALKSGGTLYSWGYNGYGVTAQGTTTGAVSTPTKIGTATNWSKISCGQSNGYGIQSDGTLWATGDNSSSQIGNGGTSGTITTMTKIGSATNWSDIIATQQGPLAMQSNGTVWRWGNSMGHGSNLASSPTQITGITTASKIGAEYTHGVILKTDGTLAAIGSNYSWGGGITAGSTTTSPTLTNYIYSAPNSFSVTTGGTIVDVKCAYNCTYFVLSSGDVWFAGLGDQCPLLTAGTYYGARYLFSMPSSSATLVIGDSQIQVWY